MDPSNLSPSEELLFTTARIETSSPQGQGTGTTFAFSLEHEDNNYPFLITNKHVIDGAQDGVLTFTKSDKNGNPIIGSAHQLRFQNGFESLWYGHQDSDIDVAVTPLAPLAQEMNQRSGVTPFIPPLPSSLIPEGDALSDLDALEEVTFIGYPNGIWDSSNFLPVARKGTTATPITIDFQGKKQFLIDASVFPGSSGSPVLILNVGMHTSKFGKTRIASRILFLGIVAAVFFKQEVNEIQRVSQPAAARPVAISKQMIDLGIVFKASSIVETIEDFLRSIGVNV